MPTLKEIFAFKSHTRSAKLGYHVRFNVEADEAVAYTFALDHFRESCLTIEATPGRIRGVRHQENFQFGD